MTGKKGETECRFIRRKTYVKHSILIRSDRKCFETLKNFLQNFTLKFTNEW